MLISVLVSLLSAPVPLVPAAIDTPLEPTATEHPVDSTVEPSSAEYFELVDSDHDGYLDAEEMATLPWDEGEAPDSAELKAFLDWYDEDGDGRVSLTDVLMTDDAVELEEEEDEASMAPEEKRSWRGHRGRPGHFGSKLGFFGGRRPGHYGRHKTGMLFGRRLQDETATDIYFATVDLNHDGFLTAEEMATLPWDEGDAPDSAELKAFLDWYDEDGDGRVSLTDMLMTDDAVELEDAVEYAGAEHSLAPEEKRGFGRIRPGPGRLGSRIGFFGGRRPIIVGGRRPIGGAGLGMLGLGAGMVAGSAMASNQGGAYNHYGAPEQQGPAAPCYSVYHRQVPCDGP